jgi:hypothetical protein
MIAREKIKLIPNVPMEFGVITPWGVERRSQFAPGGVEWKFDIEHRGVRGHIYLPRPAMELWHALRPNPGDVLEIRNSRPNDGGPVTWEVRNAASRPSYPAPTNLRTLPAPPPQQYVAGAVAPQQQPAPPAPQPAPQSQANAYEELMFRCLVCSGRAQLRAWEHLKPIYAAAGVELEPPFFEDVRAGGISISIERNRRTR